MDKCILCGAQTTNGVCPNEEQHIKKMCLNCSFYRNGVCMNETNKELATKKMMESLQVPSGYDIETIALKPIKLKDDTRKCPRYAPNVDAIVKYVTKILTPDTQGEEAESEKAKN
jgi:hypothetical protein